MKAFIKSLLPESLLVSLRPLYHGMNAQIAAVYYGLPGKKLKVIGITGTAGKSTTTHLLAHILNHSGKKTGFITTTSYSYGGEVSLNKHGLSMPNEWLLQKQLATMVQNECEYAVVECTSEGLAQNRHFGIRFYGALFTNLSPAHIDSHGSYEAYKHAKGKLFSNTPNVLGANLDDPQAEYFYSFNAEKKFGVTSDAEKKNVLGKMDVFTLSNVSVETETKFKVQDTDFTLRLPGEFNAYNAMLAIACANELGVPLEKASGAVGSFTGVPGRMEFIKNQKGVTLIVDYACEPKPLEEALKAVSVLPHKRLVHVFGTTGGHRDKEKRFLFGKVSAQYADVSVITNDDVYDSDENEIARNIREGIDSIKERTPIVTTILDRRSAIEYVLKTAEEGDLIFFTGKGSEQFLVLPHNKRIPWDERQVIRELL